MDRKRTIGSMLGTQAMESQYPVAGFPRKQQLALLYGGFAAAHENLDNLLKK